MLGFSTFELIIILIVLIVDAFIVYGIVKLVRKWRIHHPKRQRKTSPVNVAPSSQPHTGGSYADRTAINNIITDVRSGKLSFSTYDMKDLESSLSTVTGKRLVVTPLSENALAISDSANCGLTLEIINSGYGGDLAMEHSSIRDANDLINRVKTRLG